MTEMTKNDQLNQMAKSFAEGNEFALVRLSDKLGSLIRNGARSATRRAEEMSVFIPATEFESAYTEALWEAAKIYDGTSAFIQRFRTCMKRNEALVWRSYRVNKDGEPTYVKGKNDYLDKPVNGGTETLGDVVLGKMSTGNTGDAVIGENTLLNAIEDFKAQNERHYIVVKALSFEATNEEIAKAIGEETYNGKVRAVVCRARESFKKFLMERDFAI